MGKRISDEAVLCRYEVDARGCWIYTGRKVRGYGQVTRHGKKVYAHRFFYEHHVGAIPPGYCACHRCDVTACVNPSHIFIATQEANIADRVLKRRTARGERNGKARISDETAREIRASSENRTVIARRFGVSPQTIDYVRGPGWTHAGTKS